MADNTMLWIVQMLIHAAVGHSQVVQDGQIITCVINIAVSHIDEGFPITVSLYSRNASMDNRRNWNISQEYNCSGTTSCDLLHKLHYTMKWQIVTSFPGAGSQELNRALQQTYDKNKGYIIWMHNEAGVLSRQLESIRSYPNAWNSRAYFIIIVDEILPEPEHTAQQIFKELLHFKVFNVIVLIPSRGGLRALDAYTWFPYQPPSGQCGKVKGTVILDQWIMEGRGRFLRNVPLFPPKLPLNLHGCNITAAVVPQEPFVMSFNRETDDRNVTKYDEGSSMRLFLFIAEVMNMSVAFRFPLNTKEKWPVELENGSWTGVLGDLLDKNADISFSVLNINLNKSIYFDATHVYYFSGLLWIVPCSEPFHRWTNITRVFSASMWLLFFVFIIISAGFMYSLSNFHKHIIIDVGPYRTMSDCFYNVWAVFLGISVTKMPVTDHLKVYFIMLVWYSLAVNIVFQAYVTSYIVQPEYHKQIDSVEDVISSGIEYGFYPGLSLFLPDSSDWRFKEILSHRIPCYGDTCIRRAIEKKDFATVTDSTYAEYMKTYMSHKSVVCSFKQEWTTKFVAMFLEKGSFLTENINRLIDTALEAGLYDFWSNNILNTLRIKAKVGVRIKLVEDYNCLLLSHLQSAFYLLQLGYCLSFITFLGELLYNKQRTKINSLNRKNMTNILPALMYTGKRRINNRRRKLKALTNEAF